jgi:hypothetical protein
MYQRQEAPTIQAFYELSRRLAPETPAYLGPFVECLASTTGLPQRGNDYPTDSDSLHTAAVGFVTAAAKVFDFSLHLQVDDPGQIDRFVETHLIDPVLRPLFATKRGSHLSGIQTEEYCEAVERAGVPNEPLLYYSMGVYWGEWQVRHRQACWTLYPPLNPVQSFPDMITQGTTICSHPFSQVCKKLTDPEGDNLAFKAYVPSSHKRYLPPYPLLASLADAEHATRQLLPEPARRGLDAEKAGDDQVAWELFCEAASEQEQPQLLATMAVCAWRLKNYGAVDGLSRRLLQLVPGHPLTCHNLAVLYCSQPGMMNDAIMSLNLALESDPTYSRAHITLASCLAEVGRKDEARKHAEWVRDNDKQLRAEADRFLAEVCPRGWFSRWLKK